MFIPLTIFYINGFLIIFQTLVFTTIGSILAIFSSLGNEYANSIRWSRQGGYYEMYLTFVNSFGKVSIPVRLAMFITILASVGSSFISVGVNYYITPATNPGKPQNETKIFNQSLISRNPYTFAGWTTPIKSDESIADVMTRKLNDSMSIPDAVAGRTYIPHLSKYSIPCEEQSISLRLGDNVHNLKDGNCCHLEIGLEFHAMDLNNTVITNRSDFQWGAVTTIGDQSWESIGSIMDNHLTYACVHKNFTTCLGLTEPYSAPPTFNQTDLPQTTVTKFIDVKGLVSVITLTTVRFQYSLPTGDLAQESDDQTSTEMSLKFLEATNAIFYGASTNDLFKNMNNTIKFKRDLNAIWTEVVARNSTTEMLLCYVTEIGAVNCRYHIARAFHLTSDDIDGIPMSLRLHTYQNLLTMMTIQHLPKFQNGIIVPISISQLRQRTNDSAEYMAQLGQNYALDNLGNTLYIVYDTTDPIVGYRIPNWIIACIFVTTFTCLGIWSSSLFFLDTRYTDSFYHLVSRELAPRIGFDAPNLMRTRIKPLRFEGAKVVPDIEDIELDSDNKSITRRSIIRSY